MSGLSWRLAGTLMLLLSATACAQTPRPAPAPVATPAPAAPLAPPAPPAPPAVGPEFPYSSTPSPRQSLEGAMMPVDRIDQAILLDDEIEVLRKGLPLFNCVIVRDQGVSKTYPTLPPMTLKNVSLGQFMQFIQASFPGVQCKRIDGPNGTLYSIRIRQEDDPLRRALVSQSRVRLFRLNEFINSLADESPNKDKPREEKVKEATAQVLSLIQAALEQTDDKEPCTVKIHEPTLTLMFKGSQEKQAVLEEALSALSPRRSGFAPPGSKPRPQSSNRWDRGDYAPDLDMLPSIIADAQEKAMEARAQAAQVEAMQKQLRNAATTQRNNKD